MIGKIQILLVMVCIAGASYDEFLTCESLSAHKRSARVLEQIPCDMSKKPYCESMGSSYPRDAIWRFKEENRALMKRMVGDLDSREVYREMRSSSFNVMPINDHMFNGLLDQYNFRIGSGLAMVKNAKAPKIQAPATERPTETTADVDYETVGRETVTVMTSTSKATTKITTSESISSTTMAPSTTITPTVVTTDQATTMQTLSDTTIQVDDTTVQEEVVEEVPEQESRTEPEYDTEEYEEYVGKEGGYYAGMLEEYTDKLKNTLQELDPQQIEAVLPAAVQQFLTDDFEKIEEETESLNEMTEDEEEEIETTEEVDEIPEIEYTGEAINACPVKVEVKAPYWANNTRNQVLALLNLYPFEQYIHMEECTYELEEMLCRPGCRCEQQWRLHRLLAFDPNNECRGIFSDWFRFPSFCLCKCYNVPEQIIEGLRKPRVLDASQYKPKVKKTLGKKKQVIKNKPLTPKDKAPAKLKALNEAREFPEKKLNLAQASQDMPGRHHGGGPGPTHNSQNEGHIENEKLMNHRWTKDTKHPHIPAVFPYEGKMAYMAEISSRGAKGIKDAVDQFKETPEEKILEELPIPLPLVNQLDDNHQDNLIDVANINKGNMYIKDTEKNSKLNDEHFFYNQPIIEYKLSDGTTGTIPKTPRK